MNNESSAKTYDLEERTLAFAKNTRQFCQKLPKTIFYREDCIQLIRSSGSIGANYIEANEAISRKDFVLRIKISLKEAKESQYWLQVIDTKFAVVLDTEKLVLIKEVTELIRILASILRKFTHV